MSTFYFDDERRLRSVVDLAKEQAMATSRPDVAHVTERVYQRSLREPHVRQLFVKILHRATTVEETVEFRCYIELEWMKLRAGPARSSQFETHRIAKPQRSSRRHSSAPPSVRAIQTPCLLFVLPRELRDLIYGFVVGPNCESEKLVINQGQYMERKRSFVAEA